MLITNRRFRRTTMLLALSLAVLVGLGLARLITLDSTLWVWCFGVLSLTTFWNRRLAAVVAIVLFGLTLGLWRGSVYVQRLSAYGLLYKQPVVLYGTVTQDGVYADKSQLSFVVDNIHLVEPYRQRLVGKLGIAGFGVNMVYRGDTVQIKGDLWPTMGSQQANVHFASIKVLKQHVSLVETIRHRFNAGVESSLPEPEAPFGLGLLVGLRNTLPDTVSTQLAAVGLTHIIAVSGYNLTIIIRAVRRLLKKGSKYQTTVVSFGLIGLFLLMTGLSPSIVRAAIVSGLSLLAWYYGRRIRPLLLIVFTAAITGLWNPLYPWGDIGWYLSFLAFFGVLIIAPALQKRLLKTKAGAGMSQIVIETMSAQLMVLPLIAFIFGKVSIISLLANLLVVPLVPLAMLLSLVAGLAGMAIPLVSGWLAWPASILLTYMLDVAQALSRVPLALVSIQINAVGMLFLYGCIVAVTVVLWRKTTAKYGKITEIETL